MFVDCLHGQFAIKSRALGDISTRIPTRAAELCFFFIFLRACVSREKSFMFLVRGGVEGKMGRYNIPPHPQQC